MEPKYSIMLVNQQIAEYRERIDKWLHYGIKVLWFGKQEDVSLLKETYPDFSEALLLLAFSFEGSENRVIIDGIDAEPFVSGVLSVKCRKFNSEQYLVEHCPSTEHINVQASAGTGKTTVMIDRILYLLHTEPDLHLSDIFMITFTNDATDQMNKKLQDILMKRYHLTRQKRYFRWVEEHSQMHVSTIHSFALYLLKEYGIVESFTKGLSIRSLIYDKRELVKDEINKSVSDSRSIMSQLGVPFYRANSLISEFWQTFSRLGIDYEDVQRLDWGLAKDGTSSAFQKTMIDALRDLDDKYFEIKRSEEAVAIDDIIRDLREVLKQDHLPVPDISMKYLFIDEFQDADLAQIAIACQMVKLLNAKLFVVGDVKQSIYRFRGANEKAFQTLLTNLHKEGIKNIQEYTLVNNYRTKAGILDRLDGFFRVWGKLGMLDYTKGVVPFIDGDGTLKIITGLNPREQGVIEQEIIKTVKEELNRLVVRVDSGELKVNRKNRVVMLTRTNRQLKKLSRLLHDNKIPASVVEEGSFYASAAVRDFYMMVSSYMFADDPKHVFNYLLTPYAGLIEPMDVSTMEHLHGDQDSLVEYLRRYITQTSWEKYYKELRLRPVMAVFKEMIDKEHVVENYVSQEKSRLKADRWEKYIEATYTRSILYQADLERLLEILQENLNGEKISLYDVYHFLSLQIATNREESEPEIQVNDDYHSVLCMTVHKAKGLEFETVILPYTDRGFNTSSKTEVLIDPVEMKAGWYFSGTTKRSGRKKLYKEMKNSYYDELKAKDEENEAKEEIRILYVAMTRAVGTLICIVPDVSNENNWAYYLSQSGV